MGCDCRFYDPQRVPRLLGLTWLASGWKGLKGRGTDGGRFPWSNPRKMLSSFPHERRFFLLERWAKNDGRYKVEMVII